MPRVRAITGATCNRFMAILHRARELAMDKLGVDFPRLTFPRSAHRRYVITQPAAKKAALAAMTEAVESAKG
jgi:hypothetical protein